MLGYPLDQRFRVIGQVDIPFGVATFLDKGYCIRLDDVAGIQQRDRAFAGTTASMLLGFARHSSARC